MMVAVQCITGEMNFKNKLKFLHYIRFTCTFNRMSLFLQVFRFDLSAQCSSLATRHWIQMAMDVSFVIDFMDCIDVMVEMIRIISAIQCIKFTRIVITIE